MANRPFLTSLGLPYFALTHEQFGTVDVLPEFGLATVEIEVRVDELPQQLASPDELHPLFSWHHENLAEPAIFELGVTPSGRIKALAKSGSTWQSAGAVVGSALTWHFVQIGYDSASGQWGAIIDNGPLDEGTVDPMPQALVPNADRQTRLMLFNGKSGISRTHACVRNLFVGFQAAVGPHPGLIYDFHDGYGDTIEAEVLGDEEAFTEEQSVMTATLYNPGTQPWGAVPTGSPASMYRWGLMTEYTRVPKRVTKYTRVPA